MKSSALKSILERVEAWPEAAQDELADILHEIEAELESGVYHATPAELAGIDRGLQAAAEGRFATEAEVEAVFAKFRRT